MWLTKKSKDKWILNNKEEVLRLLDVTIPEKEVVPEKPKPTTRKAIMEVTVLNNKTDKEFIIKSENDFGLSWEFYGIEKVNRYEVLQLRQNHSADSSVSWTSRGTFRDFSIMGTVWKTFDIKPEEQEINK